MGFFNLGSSSIWVCPILNIEYLLLFFAGRRSENQNKYSKVDTSKLMSCREQKLVTNVVPNTSKKNASNLEFEEQATLLCYKIILITFRTQNHTKTQLTAVIAMQCQYCNHLTGCIIDILSNWVIVALKKRNIWIFEKK